MRYCWSLGAIIATAGVALVGSGISVQDHTFDPSVITPGMVGIVGGFLLIGFGLAVWQLIRIEHALALRPFGANVIAEFLRNRKLLRRPSHRAFRRFPVSVSLLRLNRPSQPHNPNWRRLLLRL